MERLLLRNLGSELEQVACFVWSLRTDLPREPGVTEIVHRPTESLEELQELRWPGSHRPRLQWRAVGEGREEGGIQTGMCKVKVGIEI